MTATVSMLSGRAPLADDLVANDVHPDLIPGVPVTCRTDAAVLAAAVVKNAIDEARGFVSPHSLPARMKTGISGDALAWLRDVDAANGHGGATWSLAQCALALGVHPEVLSCGALRLVHAADNDVARVRHRRPRVVSQRRVA